VGATLLNQVLTSSPLDAINRSEFDGWEIALYIMTFAFFIEESVKFFKNLRLANNPLNAIVRDCGCGLR
jgi:hypothetical protein